MAGGKETPRQRMIGMMYLVLTALLALQIKDTVLEKFVLIEGGLEASNQFYQTSNQQALAGIDKAARDQGSKEKDMAVVTAAQQVRQKTQELIKYLDELKNELGLASSKGNPDKIYNRSTLKKYEEPSRVLVEKKGAEELENQLNNYNSELTQLLAGVEISRSWPSLAQKAEDFELYNNRPDERKKDYAQFNFYKSPLASVLAQLTLYKNQVYGREAEVLSLLGGSVGAESIKGFDQISGMVVAKSRLVPAGTNFKGEVFLTASNSALAPTITMNGRSVKTDATGKGILDFPATARENEYNKDGQVRRTLKGVIKYNSGGEEKEVNVSYEYTVVKPTIQVGLNAVSALYLNCANNLKIDVPTLGANYRPKFTVTGGNHKVGATTGDVVIVPKQRNVKVAVASGGSPIGSVAFAARQVPLPTFKLQINGKDYDAKTGLNSAPSSVNLTLVVDPDFRRGYPDDTKFFVTKGEVQLARGRTAVRRIPISKRTRSVNLNKIRAIARPGDRIVVEVQEITRFNFENKPEVFTFGEIRQMTINAR